MLYWLANLKEEGKYMIRKVKYEEIPELYPFVLRILSDMELPVLNEISEELLEDIIVNAMHSPHYRYGYEHAWVCERDGKIAGVFFGYPGEWEALIDGPLRASMLKFDYPMEPTPKENETLPGEWYLDTLVTHPDFRRQGVGREMIEAACDLAKEANYRIIALNCEIENEAAYRLYKKMGFERITCLVLNEHVYWHMTKKL